MARILGISAFYHDSAAALVVDGRIVAAAQEERFTRRKQDADFPIQAVEYCLREGRFPASDLDYVVFYEKPLAKFDRLLETYLAHVPRGFASFRLALPAWMKDKLHLRRRIRDGVPGADRAALVFTDHHESHAASAFFPSPFASAAILTLDGVGEWTTTAWGTGHGNRLELRQHLQFPHSLGLLYSAFTYYCGFKVNSGEYKLMGLAPYGRPIFRQTILDELLDLRDDGSFWLNQDYFDYCAGLTMTSSRFHELFGGPPRAPESLLEQRHMDLAASIQSVTEEAILRIGRTVHRETGERHLVMAGGVALNCVANGRLLREGPFEDIWIQPAAGDAGGALGAALFAHYQLLENPRALSSPATDAQQGSLLGPSFANEDVAAVLKHLGLPFDTCNDESVLLDRVSRCLAEGRIVGWFQGRMEFGPRALGARSILGDARQPGLQATMNLKIKFRESFRPFAPIVLRERASQIFDLSERHESPYMLLVAPVRETHRRNLSDDEARRMELDPDLRQRVNVVRSTFPAITHVDYSARIQTVDESRHGRLCRLLRAFEALTGSPVLVNTSFNVRGEPIVCTPADACRCFLATEMDVLAIENHLLFKERMPAKALATAKEGHLDRFQPD
ncbi:MAG: carbamoyltransferase [Verrucomicrobiales bacterium]|nr:carbamoyltransferase [Verrucomicrobiales bacterium]